MNKLTLSNHFSKTICIPCIQKQQQDINSWLQKYERNYTPIYSSVDIRDAGFKIAVVDTNIFPAGFNNLCEHGIADSINFFKNAINKRVPGAKRILIAAEEHTRNTWYLENIRILQEIIHQAGFDVIIATFFNKEPSFCEQPAHAIELETATGKTVKIHCFRHLLGKIKSNEAKFDLMLMNNDLTGGIPDDLVQTGIPIFPSIHAGWHSRLKSEHFRHTNELMKEFSYLVGLDPWLFSCLYRVVDANVNNEEDRQKLYIQAKELFEEIQAKYTQHGIEEKPFIFMKSDSGTYGLGVTPIENPEQILELNSRKRKDLSRDKAAQEISRFILQEGVPTIHRIEEHPSEVCIYQIDNNLVGGFYRLHTGKNSRENLNSPGGMEFQKMCPHLDKYGKDCGIDHNLNIFDIYRILARIAGVAATREIKDLEHRQ
jgi:glutamate--cysteine ligase